MEKVQVQVELPKEAYELAQALKKVVEEVKKAGGDGFQPIVDVPAVLMASLNDLMAGLSGVERIGGEASESLSGVVKAFGLAGAEIAELLLKKAPVA